MMRKINYRLIKSLGRLVAGISIVALLFVVLAPVVSADHVGGGQEHPLPRDIDTTADLLAAINRIADFLFTVLVSIAVLFIILAAFFYLTAGGNQTQLDRAKSILVYAIIAAVLALIAGGILAIVTQIILGKELPAA